ncbi:pyocin activator PrtN family protein [Vibrio cholerae]
MNTAFLLMAEYESAVVPLSQISQKYFGLAPQTAKFRANAGKLPVPVFRASQKAKYLVSIQDLAEYIDRMREGAREL